jgi:hypothetical protein
LPFRFSHNPISRDYYFFFIPHMPLSIYPAVQLCYSQIPNTTCASLPPTHIHGLAAYCPFSIHLYRAHLSCPLLSGAFLVPGLGNISTTGLCSAYLAGN